MNDIVAEMEDDALKGYDKRYSKRAHLEYCIHHGMTKLNVAWQYGNTSVLSVSKISVTAVKCRPVIHFGPQGSWIVCCLHLKI